MKGIRAEPQQPELPRLREALAAADKVVLLAEGADVSQMRPSAFGGYRWGSDSVLGSLCRGAKVVADCTLL